MTPDRATLVAEARRWIGTPYAHQQSLIGVGCDCLGLIRALWRFAYDADPGPVPDYSSDWADASGKEALLDAAFRLMVPVPSSFAPMAGDVLLFRWRAHLPAKHCALVSGPGRIIHAYDAAGKVCEVNLAPAWRARIAGAFSFPGLAGER